MNRVYAREVAYKLIFGYIFTQEVDTDFLEDINHDNELDRKDIDYIRKTYANVITNYVSLTDIIAKYSKGFRFDRIYKADLAVLMLACAEMMYDNTIPLKVSIKECIDIIKKYSSDKSHRFVNGILASVYREIEPNAQSAVPKVEAVESIIAAPTVEEVETIIAAPTVEDSTNI